MEKSPFCPFSFSASVQLLGIDGEFQKENLSSPNRSREALTKVRKIVLQAQTAAMPVLIA
jgi:hypothetical protein